MPTSSVAVRSLRQVEVRTYASGDRRGGVSDRVDILVPNS